MNLNLKEKITLFIDAAKRILIVSKKPDKNEFQAMAKVTGLGILVIGVVGYIVRLVFALMGV
jgi:protein transport protein SEC61 subunit gamma-like protein